MGKTCVYCGNISTTCLNKLPNGQCKTDGLNEGSECKFAAELIYPEMGFLIEYLYNIHNGTPRVIDVATGIHKSPWMYDFYCTQIDKQCAYQTRGGKCNRAECLVDDKYCTKQASFTKDIELATRLLQRIHYRLEKQQKQIAEMQQNQK